MTPSPYDRMSSSASGGMMSPNPTGPPEADDYTRRSFSQGGAKRGRQPESNDRQYSAQERWLAQAGLGFDAPMASASGSFFGGRSTGGTPDPSLRGRDTGSRQAADPGQMAYGMPTARRMSGMNYPAEHPGGHGSASAPISPVKQVGALPDHRQNGTWSAQVSPRQASQARLPAVVDTRIPGVALPPRRASGNAGRGGPAVGTGFDARLPHGGPPSNGYARYASPPSTAYINNAGARRAYSVGPGQNAAYGASGGVPPTDSGYSAYAQHQPNGTSPLPAFQPFGGAHAYPQNGNMQAMSPPSFISPTSLLSPETRSTPLDNYAMYHMKGDTTGLNHVGAIGSRRVQDSDRGADDNEALDALASGLKEVALGLDAGEEARAPPSAQSSFKMPPGTNNVPPPRKSSA
jgi:hypothetical protein